MEDTQEDAKRGAETCAARSGRIGCTDRGENKVRPKTSTKRVSLANRNRAVFLAPNSQLVRRVMSCRRRAEMPPSSYSWCVGVVVASLWGSADTHRARQSAPSGETLRSLLPHNRRQGTDQYESHTERSTPIAITDSPHCPAGRRRSGRSCTAEFRHLQNHEHPSYACVRNDLKGDEQSGVQWRPGALPAGGSEHRGGVPDVAAAVAPVVR